MIRVRRSRLGRAVKARSHGPDARLRTWLLVGVTAVLVLYAIAAATTWPRQAELRSAIPFGPLFVMVLSPIALVAWWLGHRTTAQLVSVFAGTWVADGLGRIVRDLNDPTVTAEGSSFASSIQLLFQHWCRSCSCGSSSERCTRSSSARP